MGVGALPFSLIVLGSVLLCLFIANCVAIFSKDGKFAMLKKILGGFYSIIGVIMLIVGYTQGSDIVAESKFSITEPANLRECTVLANYGEAFQLGLATRGDW